MLILHRLFGQDTMVIRAWPGVASIQNLIKKMGL